MKAGRKLGFTPDQIYNMSYFEIDCYISDWNDTKKEDLQGDLQQVKYQCWLTAGLVLAGLGGKLPDLEEILGGTKSNEIDINDEERLIASFELRARMLERGVEHE